MGGDGYNRSLFTYETLVHAISGAAVSSIYANHEYRVSLLTLDVLQGSVVAMATFFPLDTVRSRLQSESCNVIRIATCAQNDLNRGTSGR